MQQEFKVKLKKESIDKDMCLSIINNQGDEQVGYFKKFFYKDDKNKNVYRQTLSELKKVFPTVDQNQFFIMITDHEQDFDYKSKQSQYVKITSIQLKDVFSVYCIVPNKYKPLFAYLQSDIHNLKQRLVEVEEYVLKRKNKKSSIKQ